MTMKDTIFILATCIASAVGYGIIHDQITARICVEYFTIGHPPIIGTDDPTLLGIGWGILATWWVGLILGIGLTIAARLGSRPKRTCVSLLKPIFHLIVMTAFIAVGCGIVGAFAASRGWVFLLEPLKSLIRPDRQVNYLAVLWTHSASYLVSGLAGLQLIIQTWRSRRRDSQFEKPSTNT
jgi:phosphoglycerol transferase MdoB-like AlkP superfamily enzyme